MGEVSERYFEKLVAMGMQFQKLYSEKKYPQAKYLYDKALSISVFLELPKEQKAVLFGNTNDEEEGTNDELFRRDYLDTIDWKCCITQHKTYQDVACRRAGEKVRYYSDDDYCAVCRQQKRAN